MCQQILLRCILHELALRQSEFLFTLSHLLLSITNIAQVGGLPLVELNHLELQFLLLNDFKLSIPLEELDAYGTMLVEFYASEIVNQQQPTPQPTPQPTSP